MPNTEPKASREGRVHCLACLFGEPCDVGYILDARDGGDGMAYWWKPNGCGYTSNLDEAGLYSREEYAHRIGESQRVAHVFVAREQAERACQRRGYFEDVGVPRESVARSNAKREARTKLEAEAAEAFRVVMA